MKATKNYKQQKELISAQDLYQGDMMEVEDNDCPDYSGEIILRAYDCFVSLTTAHTWNINCTLTGRKLLPGESVTITQE